MAATPESKVKAKIHAILKANDAYAVNYIGGMHANNGTPDILACVNGRFIGIEAKAGSNRPTDLQMSNLRRIYEAGGSALVINDVNLHMLDGVLSVIRMNGAAVHNLDAFERPSKTEEDAPRLRKKDSP